MHYFYHIANKRLGGLSSLRELAIYPTHAQNSKLWRLAIIKDDDDDDGEDGEEDDDDDDLWTSNIISRPSKLYNVNIILIS